jgi:hypothetical protein
MKLKLETVEGVAVLTVSETLVMQDIQILKAGLSKLFAAEKKKVVLDLRAVAEATLNEEVRLQLAMLPSWAQTVDAQVLNVSLLEAVGQAPEREAAIKLFDNPLTRVAINETKLAAQVRSFQRRKDELEKQLSSDPASAGLKELRKQNKDLIQQTRVLQDEINRLMKGRRSPYPADAEGKKWKELNDTVLGIMNQNKMLQGGPK